MNITNIINSNNLYHHQDIQTYVQPFSDGSDFFWNKTPSYTQFINDENKRFEQFFRCIRQKKQLSDNSIYFEHEQKTQDINKIRKSNFFSRISNTYLFSRTYDRTILSTDSDKTFYLCLIKPTEKILNDFINIKGKFLFIFNQPNNKIIEQAKIAQLNIINAKDCVLIYNYEPTKSYDLFNF